MPDINTRAAGFGKSDSCMFIDWLATELAPTILGNKPATVLSFMDSTYEANLTNWRQYRCMLANTVIHYLPLRTGPNLETVLFYRAEALKQCIMDNCHKCFFSELGYPVNSLEKCLALLRDRFRHSCPHEVGVLLGIPMKDVLGFMGMTDLPLTCRKEWCIYGDPDVSIAAIDQFTKDKSLIACLLAKGISSYEIMCGNVDVLDDIA